MEKYSFDVSAGIGLYNASQAFDYSLREISFIFAVTFNYILVDTSLGYSFNDSSCHGLNCLSTYFPGSLNDVHPRPNKFLEAQLLNIPDVQGLRIDYWDVDLAEVKSINQDDLDNCPIYGGSEFAFRVCIAPSSLNVDHLIVGMTFTLLY
jgi:hypothetical protein